MRWRPLRADTRVAGPLAILLALLAIALAWPGDALAGARAHPPGAAIATTSAERAAAARVLRFWTPQRMREARPLGLVRNAGGEARLRIGSPTPDPGASASFLAISEPDLLPYAVNGRIFVRRGELEGYCSGTAIDSPTRRLVLTAGHCLNSGREDGKASVWSDYVQFVPAFHGGVSPFGAFVARRGAMFAPQQWTKQGNPDFDLGAFLTLPNNRGENVADAVGGGATIALNQSRYQDFQTFGYPGKATRLQGCRSPYVGSDRFTNRFPGPPTSGIRCRWAPGASGGGWLIGDGSEINGINAYLHLDDKSRTYGPYFSRETVGKLVRGL
ncbi:MAG TPA: hypothetical protein VFX85_07655 [Solirubrobacterales bacterium]|nr:hypothetical protein [Solirubrobacterales bacterium]